MELSGTLLPSVLLPFITSTVQIRGNKTKKGEEGRQAPEPQPKAGGTRKSMMKQNPFPEKRKKKEKGRQAPEPSRNQEETVNHDGTEPFS